MSGLQLHDRLKREGVKTHKERVEELNRYLSAQSEHHDMYAIITQLCDGSVLTHISRPKIGPG